MALDFPSSPVLNQVYTAEGMSFIWNGTVWLIVGAAAFAWATDAEAIDGLAVDKVLSPSNLPGLIDAVFTSPGRFWLPDQVLVQFGVTTSIASGGNAGITFPIAYLQTPLFLCSPIVATNNTLGHTVGGRAESTSVGRVYNTSPGASGAVAAAWIAIGQGPVR